MKKENESREKSIKRDKKVVAGGRSEEWGGRKTIEERKELGTGKRRDWIGWEKV